MKYSDTLPIDGLQDFLNEGGIYAASMRSPEDGFATIPWVPATYERDSVGKLIQLEDSVLEPLCKGLRTVLEGKVSEGMKAIGLVAQFMDGMPALSEDAYKRRITVLYAPYEEPAWPSSDRNEITTTVIVRELRNGKSVGKQQEIPLFTALRALEKLIDDRESRGNASGRALEPQDTPRNLSKEQEKKRFLDNLQKTAKNPNTIRNVSGGNPWPYGYF